MSDSKLPRSKPCPSCEGTGFVVSGRDMRPRRHAAGLTLKDVAREMGISHTYVSHLERDARQWDPELARRYLRAVERARRARRPRSRRSGSDSKRPI